MSAYGFPEKTRFMEDIQALMNSTAALGIGLLVGLERERKKKDGPSRKPAGLRTFAATSLLGYTCMLLGNVMLLAAMGLALAALLTAAYLKSRSDDPGLTTEVALLLVLVLGGLCLQHPGIAVAIGVVLTLLLLYRQDLHHFVRDLLSEKEIRDGLILACATLVILPLMPNRFIGPFDAINPRTIWMLTILMMTIGAAGHIAVRMAGPRYGLAITGFASGFVSSTATIAAMGTRAREKPTLLAQTSTGAILSTMTTMLQMGLVLGAVNLATLQLMWLPLLLGCAVAVGYALVIAKRGMKTTTNGPIDIGNAFSLKFALLVALTIAGMSLLLSALLDWVGPKGALVAAAFGGFADAHAVSASVAALVESGHMQAPSAILPILGAITTNTFSKCFVAWVGGGVAYSKRVIPGLLLILAAVWAGAGLRLL